LALVIVLIAAGTALAVTTRWEAVRRRSGLDERELAARDRAYRVAHKLLIAGVMLIILTAWLMGPHVNQLAGTPPDGLGVYRVLALAGLFLLGPTLVISWLRPTSPT
jgi:hypothetical protein